MKKIQSNQEYIRYNNQRRIIEIMQRGAYSCTDIAKETGLSNTAVENIVNDLVERGIVVLSTVSEVGARGRRPIKYQLNGELGCVASVELADRDMVVCIANVNRQILYCAKLPDVIIITQEVLEKLMQMIREGLRSPCLQGKKLLGICIASPGLIDSETGYYRLAPRIENYKEVNITEMFRKEFDCDVIVKKDIVAGAIGEMKFGMLSQEKPRNAIFLHLDINIGAAFVFDGKIYEGNNGYLGELGFYMQNVNEPQKGLGLFVSITAIFLLIKERLKRENILHPLSEQEVPDFDQLKFLFLSGDEVVENAVRQSAKSLALLLLNLNYLLDIQRVVIDGKMVEFGAKFLNYVDHYLEKYDRKFVKVEVGYSNLMNRAITLGCICCVIDSQFDKILKG